jgi:pyrroline-5-carboxylate reductase
MAGSDQNLVLVGAGKMGAAMLSGWLDQKLAVPKYYILDPQVSEPVMAMAGHHNIFLNPLLSDIGNIGAVVLAVKPQVMAEVALEIAGLGRYGPVFISIAAGCTIASFETVLGSKAAIVRSMPNTPAAIGRGITVACANDAVSDEQKSIATQLLQAVGKVAWVEDEGLLDPVTAVSGSGPAYVFLLAECMAQAGVAAGLPEDLAEQLARETVSGAGELLAQSDETAGQLRKNVTSPGGTTAAALDILRGPQGLADLMTKAVAAATKRSRELAG